ncbi:SMI1/KNR4 family protein [Kitasatospora sp. NPDC048722]|uniref:SMI1/KNR4 family protein n=1 Tax=Kitasatospora sp. NPDC048722 TaxID=3155639 RepID=UPI0033D3A889
MHPSVARLTGILPPHPGAGDPVDWDEAAARWGTRFPLDYRDFVSTYGGGSINASFAIGLPLKVAAPPGGPLGFEELTEDGHALLDPDADGNLPPLHGRISWATDCSAGHAFWDTADPDPDKWTTLVLDRYGDWTAYDCGMADFLVGFLTGGISPQPMGMFSRDRPVFLNWREERRLRGAGITPWPGL